MLGRTPREQNAQQLGFQTGKTIMEEKPDCSIAERQAMAYEVVKQHGLKRTNERMSFYAAYGDGVAEGMVQNARSRHSR